MRTMKFSLAALLIGGLISSSAWAASQRGESVLGAEGELYTVRTGTYGQLFPGGKQTQLTNAVLALEVTKPDGTEERLLVNGTTGPEAERLPFLRFEEASKTLFLVWESRVNLVHPILMLSGYNNGSWIEPFEIIGNPFAPKTSPQFAVTQDTYEEQGPNGPLTRHRTTIHLAWGEEIAGGLISTFYTPVFLENGTFVGRSPVYRLNDLELPEAPGETATPQLAQVLRVQRGRDERTVVVAFTSLTNGRINTLEIDALPAQLSLLADGARAHIIDLGAKLYPGKMQSLAEEARAHIIDLGRSFQPVISGALASQAQAYILINGSSPGSDLKAIADGARAHIIDLGAKLSGRGLKTAASELAPPAIVEVQPLSLTATPDALPFSPQFLEVQLVSSRVAPEVGRGDVRMFMSESGQEVLLAWIDGQRVLYVETSGQGWSETREVRITPSFDSTDAFEVLERRVLNR
jgi:hypothetical protein